MGIPGILAGILTQLALYSINLRIMGNRSNVSVSVDQFPLMASIRYPEQTCLIALLFCVGIVAVLCWFFGTELGSAVRATGSNPNMARAQGINTNGTKMVALILSNALVGLSGGLFAQYQSASDVNMGRGAIVIGLAAVIIGQVLFSRVRSFGGQLTGVVVGAIVYYIVIALVIRMGLNTNDMKLISALVVAILPGRPLLEGELGREKTAAGAYPPAYSPEIPLGTGGATMLELHQVCKTFNPGTVNEKTALNHLSLTLEEGDFVTVIGGNGAGKSTMLNAISGVWPVDEGTIRIDGVDVTELSEHRRAVYLGRVFQDPMVGTAGNMTIEENLALAARRGEKRTLRWGIKKSEREQFKELLRPLGLGLEDRLTAKVGLLSGGQRQALTLLMASLKKPKVLLLDEHTAALDPKTAAKVLELSDQIVKEHKLTTLMVTHNMKDAIAHGNRLIMLDAGRVILDIRGEDKKKLTVPDLLARFTAVSGEEVESDRLLLA